MVETRVDQAGGYALAGATPETRVDVSGVYALIGVGPPARVDQAGVYAFIAVTGEARIDQAGIYLLASGKPCTTREAQIWTITRTDGEVFRFTSLDRDLEWGGETYASCGSLAPSASEAVAEADSAGTMDLSGALGGDDGLDPQELYAGLFDGAEVEAWLVPWAGVGRQRRLLRGTFGPVEQTTTGFKAELLGDGARLQQTPLVRTLQPGCRWLFGGPGCEKDLGPLAVTGTIDSANGLRSFTDAARAEPAGYFRRGAVTFTSGANAGVSAEIKEHEAGGVFTLWPRLPFPILPGVTYEMTPGCTNLKATEGGCNGCTAWGNLLRYGGFDKVPGRDKRSGAANGR